MLDVHRCRGKSRIVWYAKFMLTLRCRKHFPVGRTIEKGERVKVVELREGDQFGDLEFVNTHLTMTEAVALSPVKVVKLNRYHSELCMVWEFYFHF